MTPEEPTENTQETVSFDHELLQVVSEQDELVDYRSKAECHDGEGILHRAFSIFIFNENNELLLQQRSSDKRLWPLYWSNTVCSHPRKGENLQQAAVRRLQEEFGFTADLRFLYKFQYHAQFGDHGSENEICSVYFGRFSGAPQPNDNEIAEWRFLSIGELENEMQNRPERFTPWFKMEWNRIRKDHLEVIEGI